MTSRFSFAPCVAICAACAVSVASFGCGRSYETVPLANVSGTVLEDGKPAVRAKVAFHPVSPITDPPLIPSGMTDDEGKFQLTTYVQHDGAPLGEYGVTIERRDVPNPGASGLQIPVDVYAQRFADPKKPHWTVKVEEGENALAPFELSKN